MGEEVYVGIDVSKAELVVAVRPSGQEKPWDWIANKSADDLLSLLAYCTALTVNAVQSKRGIGASPGQIDHSHELVDALKLDMTN